MHSPRPTKVVSPLKVMGNRGRASSEGFYTEEDANSVFDQGHSTQDDSSNCLDSHSVSTATFTNTTDEVMTLDSHIKSAATTARVKEMTRHSDLSTEPSTESSSSSLKESGSITSIKGEEEDDDDDEVKDREDNDNSNTTVSTPPSPRRVSFAAGVRARSPSPESLPPYPVELNVQDPNSGFFASAMNVVATLAEYVR